MARRRSSAGHRRRCALLALLVVLVAPTGIALALGPGGWDHLGDGGTPGTTSLNGNASALHAGAAGVLYVGGAFTDAGGYGDGDRIATWNGGAWAPVSSAVSQINNGAVL
ncbi:MAG: hypothetical protein QOI80_3255, partial [Solirubrobacteraceae bacterium]|nr:hypothetical protein [Solirubrobacteraceae bacterium]